MCRERLQNDYDFLFVGVAVYTYMYVEYYITIRITADTAHIEANTRCVNIVRPSTS